MVTLWLFKNCSNLVWFESPISKKTCVLKIGLIYLRYGKKNKKPLKTKNRKFLVNSFEELNEYYCSHKFELKKKKGRVSEKNAIEVFFFLNCISAQRSSMENFSMINKITILCSVFLKKKNFPVQNW